MTFLPVEMMLSRRSPALLLLRAHDDAKQIAATLAGRVLVKQSHTRGKEIKRDRGDMC